MSRAADDLARAVRRLVGRVSSWTPSRWAASSGVPTAASTGTSRADVVYALVQEMADLAADAEGQPRRRVPRLRNDSALPDQFRVMVSDLVAAHPPEAELDAAADRIRWVNRSLAP